MNKHGLVIFFLLIPLYAFCQTSATFYDDFKTNKNNWLICNNVDLVTELTPKGYTLNNKSKFGQGAYHDLPIHLKGDYTFEATITRDFHKENYGFGLMFGGSDPGNLYQFLMEVSGDYHFFKYENFKYVEIIPWTAVPGVSAIGKPNTIKIECKKGTLHFYINGTEVNQYKNFQPKGSLHGIALGPHGKITVNNFKVTYAPVGDNAVMLDSTKLPDNFILNEEFNNNYMQWDLHADHSQLKNGFYELSNPKDSYLFWEDYAMFKVHDFAVETELVLVNGSHLSPYGILLGIKGWAGDFLEFDITANGFFRLSRSEDWESKPLKPWKFSSAIKSKGINLITAHRKNDSLYFYINRKLAIKHPDVKLAGNGVGWILTNDVRKVNVNYIRIRQPLQKVISGPDVTATELQRLTSNVNTSAEEFAPVVSPDGSVLYFTRDENPDIHGLEKDDIFYAELTNGQWGAATKMPAPLNNSGDCGVISVSADNQTLLLRGAYEAAEGEPKEELHITHLSRSGWEKPQKVVIQGYENKDREEEFCLSNDKTILLSSIENNASLGERDLFVSFLQPDNTWSVPLNLGNEVNTTSNDFSPFLAADNKTLYYSSYGMPSIGKADIYVTRRLDDTWKNWSPPQNLGSVINTELNDQGFTLAASGTEAFFSSEKNTLGKADIFKVKLPPALQPNPVVLIHGKVFDSSTGQTMSTEIVYEDLAADKEAGKTRSHEQTGEYKIILPYGEHYGINANLEGYMPLSENIDIAERKSYQEIQVDLYLVPVRAGQNLVMKNLFFAPGSPAIAMKSYAELRKMVALVKQYPTMKITIAGHTDDGNGESSRYLQKLSIRRAEAVKNYFVTHGIPADHIQTVGYGKDKPLVPNESNEARQKNRRVEFIIDEL